MPTKIQWANETWNIVIGCSRVSPGCDLCYMYRQWPRLHGMNVPGYEGPPESVVIHPERLDQPYGWKQPKNIFTCSMGDLFHRDVPQTFLDAVFGVMEGSPRHTFQVLTKRPGLMAYYAEHRHGGWPANVWAGTSV